MPEAHTHNSLAGWYINGGVVQDYENRMILAMLSFRWIILVLGFHTGITLNPHPRPRGLTQRKRPLVPYKEILGPLCLVCFGQRPYSAGFPMHSRERWRSCVCLLCLTKHGTVVHWTGERKSVRLWNVENRSFQQKQKHFKRCTSKQTPATNTE